MTDGEFDDGLPDTLLGGAQDFDMQLAYYDLEARIAALEIALSANCHGDGLPDTEAVLIDATAFHAFLMGEE